MNSLKKPNYSLKKPNSLNMKNYRIFQGKLKKSKKKLEKRPKI